MSEIRIRCPRCGRQKAFMNSKMKVYFCFLCNKGGKVDKPVLPKTSKKSKIKKIDMFTFGLRTPTSERIEKYLEKRIPGHLIHMFMMWSPDLPNRAIIPIYGYDRYGNREVVFWTARAIDGSEPKYLHSGRKSKFVFMINHIYDDWCVITEGPFDALATPNGVAIFGKSLSQTQLNLIVHKFKKVYVAMDGDAGNEEIIKQLKPYVEVYDVKIDGDLDPSEIGFKGMQKKISEAVLRTDG